MNNFQNDKINLGKDEDMYFVSFGSGTKQLVIIPGLSDGLVTVKGKGRILAKYYKIFAKDFRVTVFSRKNQLKKGYTIKDMAHDQKRAMVKLGIKDAYV